MLFAACMLTVSCGISQHVMLPSTALSSNNYTYVRDVSAKISYTYVLGIGGLKGKDIVEKLAENANLLPGEALVNVGISSKFKFFLVAGVRDFVATGQVVRFTDGASNTSEFEQAQRKYEGISSRLSGYDGDLLSALPVSAVNVEFTSPAEAAMAKYGVSLNKGQIEDIVISSLTKKKNTSYDAASDKSMNITIVRVDKDACVHGYATIKDNAGVVAANVIFDGAGLMGRTPEELFLDSFKNAGNNVYLKWFNLYDMQQKQLRQESKEKKKDIDKTEKSAKSEVKKRGKNN